LPNLTVQQLTRASGAQFLYLQYRVDLSISQYRGWAYFAFSLTTIFTVATWKNGGLCQGQAMEGGRLSTLFFSTLHPSAQDSFYFFTL